MISLILESVITISFTFQKYSKSDFSGIDTKSLFWSSLSDHLMVRMRMLCDLNKIFE